MYWRIRAEPGDPGKWWAGRGAAERGGVSVQEGRLRHSRLIEVDPPRRCFGRSQADFCLQAIEECATMMNVKFIAVSLRRHSVRRQRSAPRSAAGGPVKLKRRRGNSSCVRVWLC